MIAKERNYPIRLRKYEALFNRLVENHPKLSIIEEDYKAWRAGYKGELSTDYRLSFLPEKEYLIFRDLRLADDKWYFQMDTLLLTPRYILLIETKNYTGTLYFENNSKQMTQTKDEKDKAYDNPILQVKMQKWHLERWLAENKFKIPPIYYLVTISNSSAIIKVSHPSLHKLVLKGDTLLERVLETNESNKEEIFSEKDLKKLQKLFIKKQEPLYPDLLKFYSLTEDDIRNGVQCPDCSSFGMQRMKWKWQCPSCMHTSKNAHYSAILEFLLLISPTFTNRELRKFLHVPSVKSTSSMVSHMHLPMKGNKKGRTYHMPPDIEAFFHLAKK